MQEFGGGCKAWHGSPCHNRLTAPFITNRPMLIVSLPHGLKAEPQLALLMKNEMRVSLYCKMRISIKLTTHKCWMPGIWEGIISVDGMRALWNRRCVAHILYAWRQGAGPKYIHYAEPLLAFYSRCDHTDVFCRAAQTAFIQILYQIWLISLFYDHFRHLLFLLSFLLSASK